MKLVSTLLLSLATICPPAHSQLILNAGETYTFSFSSLPYAGFVNPQNYAPAGQCSVTWQVGTLEMGEELRLDMFETSLAEAPIGTATFTNRFSSSGGAIVQDAWQDRQGAIRLSMLSGSLAIETIGFQVYILRDSTHMDVYEQMFTPVPEPSTILLFASGLGLVLCWPSKYRTRKS